MRKFLAPVWQNLLARGAVKAIVLLKTNRDQK